MIVAIIPARGGSKGVPRKNIRMLAGKPLIAYTILDALEAQLIDAVFVTTDDPEIAGVAKEFGAEIIVRPRSLSGDTASSESALVHALDTLRESNRLPDVVVFLQCTSPLRSGRDIDNAIRCLQGEGADSLLSVTRSHKFLWERGDDGARSINYDYRSRPRRQDMAPQFMENGSIYVFKPWVVEKLGNRLGGKISIYEMSEETALDIDSLADFDIAESFIKSGVL